MAAKKKAGEAAPTLEEILRKPAFQAFIAKQTAASDAVVKLGPGGTWNYNESKRAEVEELNAALHALNDLAQP